MGIFDFGSDDVLLDIDAVCKKLCISRSSLERLRRLRPENSLLRAQEFVRGDDFAGAPVFPEPTLVLGRSPRWSAKILNAWIEAAARAPRLPF